MRHKLKILIGLLFVLSCSSFVCEEDCMKLLMDAMNNTLSGKIEDGKVHYLEYYSTMKYTDPNLAATNMKTSITASGTRMYVNSGKVEFYQDDKESFTVMHSSREIYRSKSTAKKELMSNEFLSKLKDSIFFYMKIQSCSIVDGEGYDHEISAIPSGNFPSFRSISSVTYFLNTTENSMKKVYLQYKSSNAVKSLLIDYKVVDRNSNKKLFTGSVVPLFLDDKGKLLQQYAGYKLVDVRDNN